MDLTLAENLSEPTIPLNISLSSVITDAPTTGTYVILYWRWQDTPSMAPQFLVRSSAGHDVAIPFDLQGRAIDIWQVTYTALGVPSVTDILQAPHTVFTPPAIAPNEDPARIASEDITAPALINVWDDSGTPKVRKADADDPTKPATGFILADVLSGDEVIVYLNGKVTDLSGLTPGALQFLSTTAGQVTETAPSGSGKIVQQVGTALSSTTMNFEPQPAVQLA